LTQRQGHCWVQAQCLVHDTVEVGQLLENAGQVSGLVDDRVIR
jgi:hypothetical protein